MMESYEVTYTPWDVIWWKAMK